MSEGEKIKPITEHPAYEDFNATKPQSEEVGESLFSWAKKETGVSTHEAAMWRAYQVARRTGDNLLKEKIEAQENIKDGDILVAGYYYNGPKNLLGKLQEIDQAKFESGAVSKSVYMLKNERRWGVDNLVSDSFGDSMSDKDSSHCELYLGSKNPKEISDEMVAKFKEGFKKKIQEIEAQRKENNDELENYYLEYLKFFTENIEKDILAIRKTMTIGSESYYLAIRAEKELALLGQFLQEKKFSLRLMDDCTQLPLTKGRYINMGGDAYDKRGNAEKEGIRGVNSEKNTEVKKLLFEEN